MKVILYRIYAILFYIYSIVPIDHNKTTFIMTHDDSTNGNIMRMYKEIKRRIPNERCYFVERPHGDTKWKKVVDSIKFFIKTPYDLATSRAIFLDNVFLPMAFIRFKDQVKVIQLWHGCNTLKRFGQLSNTGLIKELEKKANANYTHVIVSSKSMIPLHEAAFGVSQEVIYPLGLPRMDIFFDKVTMRQEKDRFFCEFPELKEKKLILYAPTFRDNDLKMENSHMDLRTVAKELPQDYVILNKFHPFVARESSKYQSERVLDFTHYDDLSTLLIVSDLLITDYSSIIFEYALLDKPILFYAYDQKEYEHHIRGFYYDYEDYVGNHIIRNKEDLKEAIINIKGTSQFSSTYVDFKDTKSATRIYDEIYQS